VQADLVPDRGHLDAQVGVVGQEGRARLGAAPGDDPVVAPQACPERGRRGIPSPQDVGLEGGFGHRPKRSLRQRVRDDDWIIVWVGRHQHADGGGPQPGGDVGPRQFVPPVAPQVPGHHFGPGEGVKGSPGLRVELDAGESQDGELQAQASPVGGDVGVDPLGVGLQHGAGFAVQLLQFLSGGAVPAQGAEETILSQGRRAQHLRQPPGADPPPELHLPEAVLGMDVPLGEEEVVGIGGVDMGNPPTVTDDGGLCLQAVHLDRPVGPGPGATHSDETVAEADQPHRQHDHQQYQQDTQQRTHGNPPYLLYACYYSACRRLDVFRLFVPEGVASKSTSS